MALYNYFFNGNTAVFKDLVDATFNMAKVSVDIALYLVGVMSLWLGIMQIGEKAGVTNYLARLFGPLFRALFPGIPKGHASMSSIIMNFSANMLGLDNAATPMGLKAMQQLQELNPNKNAASNEQIMFLVLNTSGLTIIPISVLALRAAEGSENPTSVFIPILLATFFATLVGLIAVSIAQKINLLKPIILSYLLGLSAIVGGTVYLATQLSESALNEYSSLIGNGILFGIIVLFIVLANRKKINIYDAFIDGAKQGFNTSISILPYLVAMLVAVGVFRASGALDLITSVIKEGVLFAGLNADFVDALPVAFMKPLSGSGARALMVESFSNFGVDSFVGHMTSIMQGSTETTFYTLAVYLGSVGVKNARHALACGLIADFAGIVAAIILTYIFFA